MRGARSVESDGAAARTEGFDSRSVGEAVVERDRACSGVENETPLNAVDGGIDEHSSRREGDREGLRVCKCPGRAGLRWMQLFITDRYVRFDRGIGICSGRAVAESEGPNHLLSARHVGVRENLYGCFIVTVGVDYGFGVCTRHRVYGDVDRVGMRNLQPNALELLPVNGDRAAQRSLQFCRALVHQKPGAQPELRELAVQGRSKAVFVGAPKDVTGESRMLDGLGSTRIEVGVAIESPIAILGAALRRLPLAVDIFACKAQAFERPVSEMPANEGTMLRQQHLHGRIRRRRRCGPGAARERNQKREPKPP